MCLGHEESALVMLSEMPAWPPARDLEEEMVIRA